MVGCLLLVFLDVTYIIFKNSTNTFLTIFLFLFLCVNYTFLTLRSHFKFLNFKEEFDKMWNFNAHLNIFFPNYDKFERELLGILQLLLLQIFYTLIW